LDLLFCPTLYPLFGIIAAQKPNLLTAKDNGTYTHIKINFISHSIKPTKTNYPDWQAVWDIIYRRNSLNNTNE